MRYITGDILDKIRKTFESELDKTLPDTHFRKNGQWWIHPPQFVSKETERINWSSRVDIATEAIIVKVDPTVDFSSDTQTS